VNGIFPPAGRYRESLPIFIHSCNYSIRPPGLRCLRKSGWRLWLILERIVPKEATSFKPIPLYLYEVVIGISSKAWQKKESFAIKTDEWKPPAHWVSIFSWELNEAFQIWKARLREEGLSTTGGWHWITNGGFEKEKILGTEASTWKIEKDSWAEIIFDSSTAMEGKIH